VDLFHWTEGRALVATGSPFSNVSDNGRSIRIAQCNNSFIFPGVGLGVIAAHARRVTDEMFLAAAFALSELSPARSERAAPLYPSLEEVRNISRRVALAVGTEAQRSNVADETSAEELSRRVDDAMWTPVYVPLKRAVGF
jgi:malate dehydrogenase (oxaloacetate-decarboxylating)